MVTVGAATPASTPRPAPAATPVPITTASKAPVGNPGPGQVWVNTETKVFHRQGSKWYGTTKHGKYMSEADALKAGNRESKEN